jgi:hypothetical protein
LPAQFTTAHITVAYSSPAQFTEHNYPRIIHHSTIHRRYNSQFTASQFTVAQFTAAHRWRSVNQKDEKGKLASIKIMGFGGNSQCIIHHGTSPRAQFTVAQFTVAQFTVSQFIAGKNYRA